ncbi:MAG: F0F1 ATP synthase subunit epsilon [Acidobacteria bacterium]|nr:F0F1 ATP synthase subunit epsilon [Acidobacteriota bacterium]
MQTFKLEIVTPDKLVVDDSAEELQLPGKKGYLGILPGHAPLITELDVGELSYRRDGRTRHLCLAWGFAEVLPDKVTILAETAERAEEIDAARAERARDRAEERLKKLDRGTDLPRAQNALRRALARLRVAPKK